MAKRGENIYKRKDGRWEARVVKGRDKNGKAIYAYYYGHTYKEAKNKTAVSPAELPFIPKSIINEETHTPEFGIVLDEWLYHIKLGIKKSSYVKYHNTVKNHIKPLLGAYCMSDINSDILCDYAAVKLNPGSGNSKNGLSVKTIKDIFSVIKAALRFGANKYSLPEVDINLSLPSDRQKDMRVFSKDEQAALTKYLCEDMDECKLGVLMCIYMGLRIGEICALQWSDISIDEGLLTINRTMQRIQTFDPCSSKTEIIITEPKSGCSKRIIPIPDCLTEKLKIIRPVYQNAYFLTGKPDKYIEPRAYQYRFKTYINACGIKDANFHCTRHTFATRGVELGFELKSLSEILGHSSVNITLNRYVHPSLELKRKNMNKLTGF